MKISVAVCTHNPRLAYLRRVLDGLRAQTLTPADWELLLVDNASAPPLAGQVNLDWHPAARVIVEPQLGLTPARVRGIREAAGELLVFVDDDNVLNADYLEAAWSIGEDKPFLGAWGGSVHPEWESTPPAWTQPHWPMLALREVTRDVWSNYYRQAQPCGAGMCVRREVALAYAAQVEADSLSRVLGRRGSSLAGGEDVELAFSALERGFGTGLFTGLNLAHLIPTARLRPDYLVRLAGEMAWTSVVLEHLYDLSAPSTIAWPLRWLREGYIRLNVFSRRRAFHLARQRGAQRARQDIVKGGITHNLPVVPSSRQCDSHPFRP